MSQAAAIRLVKSLSGSEKRQFKLSTRRHSGSLEYLGLFDIIDKCITGDTKTIREEFLRQHPGSSPDNTARYLVKVVTDCLIQLKTEKDPMFGSLYGIMRAKILQERSLPEESMRELKKIRKTSQTYHQHVIEYLTYRGELNYLGDNNFPAVDDGVLVEKQMKAKEILRRINRIQDHYSLFELLKLRLLQSGNVSSDEEKKRLNDLMLSEMILVSGKGRNSFTEQKLHLLFQSFFFTHIGDYQSALKTFHSLDKLFEEHLLLLENPPLDYLSALNGILASLHALSYFDELAYYTNKVALLDNPRYPEHFQFQVKKTVVLYELAALTGKGQFAEAAQYVSQLDKSYLQHYTMVDEEKQWEIYFFCSLSYFGIQHLKKAHYYISKVMADHDPQPQLMICKAMRLLNILVHYEKGESEYLEYEIRSYKRFLQPDHKPLPPEQLLFRFIRLWPDHRRKRLPVTVRRKLIREIDSLRKNHYEKQLLRYFDFVQWIRNKIEGESSP